MKDIPEAGKVMAINSAKVSEYNGKTLNCGESSSLVTIEPTHKRTEELRKWYNGKGEKKIESLSSAQGAPSNRDDYRLISEVMANLNGDQEFLNSQSISRFFKISGYV